MKQIMYLVLTMLALLLIHCGQPASPDLILYNGKVFTADPSQAYSEAFAIEEERIVAVGTSAEILALADANTRRIDLQGHLAIPGINDAHYHSLFMPPFGYNLSFESMEPSWQETKTAVGNAVEQVPSGTWIFGSVGMRVILDPEATRFALDRIAPDHPVYLTAYWGHGDLINSNAMTLLGIDDLEPDPKGGHFERVSGSEQLNGKVWEYAQWVPRSRLINSASDEDLIRVLQTLGDEAVRYGITSIQDMPAVPLSRYVELLDKAQLPLRVRAIRLPMISVSEENVMGGRDLTSQRHRLNTVHGTKWILDGTPFERGAALREEYSDRPDWSGRINFPESEVASMVRTSLEQDEQLLLHCAGDRTVEMIFNAMEEHEVNWKTKRLRIEHGDGVIGDLIPRAAQLGVVVVQNPTHLAIVEVVAERYGPETPFFPLRTLLEAGVVLALGSDGPLNPYLNIMLATLHPIHPSEALTREQAVVAYTRGSAYAEFQEQDKGTITKGKLADIAVLSQDIFTVPVEALPATHSILTIVGGKIVYDANQLK